MKKLFYFLIIGMLFNANLYSQNVLQCAEDERPGIIDESIYSHALQRSATDIDKYVFNVFFHIIREDDGTNTTGIDADDIQNAVEMLNVTYNQFDIYFKYRGFGYIDESDFMQTSCIYGNNNDEYHNLLNRPEMHSDALNLCIVKELPYTDSQNNTYNIAGRAQRPGTFSVFAKDYFLTATLPHEIAHNFNIYHTRYHWNKPNGDHYCEHISGDNCDTKGDEVCDTPASHSLIRIVNGQTIRYVTFSTTSGQYEYNNVDNLTDCAGDVFSNVPFNNFMDTNTYAVDNYYHNLRTQFSQGQGIRMRESVVNYPNIYQPVMTTVASLYEPYEANYQTVNGQINYDQAGVPISGTIDWIDQSQLYPGCPLYWVSLIHFNYKFQKGFDYEVYTWNWDWSVDSNLNLVYDNFTYDYSFIINPCDYDSYPCSGDTQLLYNYGNIGIKILQLGQDIIPVNSSKTPMPGPAAVGSTILTSDVNLNNLEIRDLNEQETNDPNLINDLETGKVHRIIKELENGEIDTKVIYKTGN